MTIIEFASPVSALQCVKSSDDYASEMVLNKPGTEYNLNYLSNAQKVILRDNRYTYESHYNKNLLVIISEVKEDEQEAPGLSIKIQMPTIAHKENVHILDLVSKSVKGKIIPENVSSSSYKEWSVGCTNERIISECKFLREGVAVIARLNDGSYNVELEISNSGACQASCSGYCVRSGGSSTCITNETKTSTEDLLKHVGLIKNFNEFISAYNIVKNGETPINTIDTEMTEEVDWQRAMKEELAWLKSQDIIRILNDDIDKVSSLSRQGSSGHNNRVVYAKNRMGVPEWVYYNESVQPIINFDKECSEYVISPGITGGVTFETGNSKNYYLIPTFAIIIILLIFALVITFTRWNHERLKNQRKDIDKEIQKIRK